MWMLAFGLAGLAATPAQADEQYFGYPYSPEALPNGGTETELWVTDRRGKGDGHYDAQDYRIELEHGFTDRLTVSGYANLVSHHIHDNPELDRTDRDFAFQGLSAEFKYNVLSPYKDGLGLTLYAEPAWTRIHSVEGEKGTQYELELKAILQKNFLDDRLIWAANLTFEPEWEKEKEVDATTGAVETEWEKELELHVSTGLSYRVAPRWFLGVEGRYSSVYPDWTHGLHRETYAVFAGPAIHYGGKKWWATLSYQPQLFGSPSPNGGRAHDEFEDRELRLKLGYDF
jgi:opacity protein-like surface antigen